ncbi:hypothetical protein [Vibrio tritonius]|uniref:hypothetical protein n=1 Tax=Vibrio tritonius TaxID=1435069 RepID=UPI00315D332B
MAFNVSAKQTSSVNLSLPDSLIDYMFTPRLAVNCGNVDDWDALTQVISGLAWESDLRDWLSRDIIVKENNAQYYCNERGGGIIRYNGTVSIQSACNLLDAEPGGWFIIYNGVIEITRDPAFNGEVCSMEGIFN